MGYSTLRDCVNDLLASGQLIEITEEVDPNLEMSEIHRRVYAAQGPALLFSKVRGSDFPAVSNIYGTNTRCEYLFRDTLPQVKRLLELKADPSLILKNPLRYWKAPLSALHAFPRKALLNRTRWQQTKISRLPLIKSWPQDGGAFITLPQVLTLPPDTTDIMQSNLGMYRIQMNGNDYQDDQEVGMHYQLHRGIGIHHTRFQQTDKPFRVSIFVGGPPSHALSAIFPLPEGLSELTFAGLLGGRRFRYGLVGDFIFSNDADFIITGTIEKNTQKREGPFGDHLGYYSLEHDFPVLKVEGIWHRPDPIWHFTVVGRPPQEDSGFGYLIHELVGPLLSSEFPGIHQLHAVDVAGVHPLLLAMGSERYMPFRQKVPEEILTQANRILGSGQTSLAKYLIIGARDDDPNWSVYDIPAFFRHVLERIDWRRDLHFQTKTTIDTLDYSGSDWNAGSKVVMACCGEPIRKLGSQIPSDLNAPGFVSDIRVVDKGMILCEMRAFTDYVVAKQEIQLLTDQWKSQELTEFPLIVIVDDARFCQETFANFLWVTFTRSNPSHDIYGVGAFVEYKHWGCTGSLIIDARIKPHHAPVLEVDRTTKERVDLLFQRNASLADLG
ncbi:MAG: UbiD family decarboxylase [Saprospiraceae bacterium]|nr:UbiD family decarboxylase [Saprospiraceae bacterium]